MSLLNGVVLIQSKKQYKNGLKRKGEKDYEKDKRKGGKKEKPYFFVVPEAGGGNRF